MGVFMGSFTGANSPNALLLKSLKL